MCSKNYVSGHRVTQLSHFRPIWGAFKKTVKKTRNGYQYYEMLDARCCEFSFFGSSGYLWVG